MSRVNNSQGFTIIELTLSMAFVSVLLVAIAMTVIQISNVYNRGITLKEVNQAGRSLSTDITNSISAATPFSVDPEVGDRYNNSTEFAKPTIVSQEWGGALCIGQYSYIYNFGHAISRLDYSRLNYYAGATKTTKTIHFVKIYDPSQIYCETNVANQLTTPVDPTKATELIGTGVKDIVIHNFVIQTPIAGDALNDAVVTTGQQLYDISFLIGTNDSDALYTGADGDLYCKPPSLSINVDPAYCFVAKFHLVARAGNKSGN